MEILIGFILGIVGTILFWRFQINIKPKIAISNIIAKGYSSSNPEKVVYRIKVYNLTNRQIVNISIACSLSYIVNVGNGQRSVGKTLNINPQSIQFLGPKKNWGDPFGLSPVKVFHLTGLESAEFSSSKKILFTISATDAESGTTNIIRKIYEPHDVKDGNFEPGLFFKLSEDSENLNTNLENRIL